MVEAGSEKNFISMSRWPLCDVTISDDTSRAWCEGGDRRSLSCESLLSDSFLDGDGSLQLRRKRRSAEPRVPTADSRGSGNSRAEAETGEGAGARGESEMKSGKLDRCCGGVRNGE